ncbi:MAG: peptidylprolyl isomerase [Elusimicrobiota bacterium]
MIRFAAVLLAAGLAACAQTPKKSAALKPLPPSTSADSGRFAVLTTSRGEIRVKLLADEAPLAVKNFTSLAAGKSKRPFYNGTHFFKVIPGFIIQGGDPLNTGQGGAGYTFADEFYPRRKFDRAGLVALASSAPDSNSSQFFITLAPAPWLDGKHTIFGEVVEGMDVVAAIAAAPLRGDRPVMPQVLRTVRIEGEK